MYTGASLVVQWLRLCAPNAGGPGLIPGKETRSRMPQLRVHMPQLRSAQVATKTWCNRIKKFCIQFKDYFPFTVITEYWLYSPCCTIHPCSVSYTQIVSTSHSPTSILPLPFHHPPPLVTSSVFSTSVSLLLFCYIP